MKSQKEVMNEIERQQKIFEVVNDRVKTGRPLKGDKQCLKTIRKNIDTLKWVLTP